jgi:hypothetical protein
VRGGIFAGGVNDDAVAGDQGEKFGVIALHLERVSARRCLSD